MNTGDQYYYGEPGGDAKGPLDYHAIKAAVNCGRLTRNVLLSRDGAEPWAAWEVWAMVGDAAFDNGNPETRAATERMQREREIAALGDTDGGARSGGIEYKVLTQRDKWFSGRFDPAVLEKVLNQLASEGWRVVSMASASREGVLTGGSKDEMVILLERRNP